MPPKPKAAEAGAKTKTATGTASEAQSGTMSPAMGTAGATADAAGADTLAADAGGTTLETQTETKLPETGKAAAAAALEFKPLSDGAGEALAQTVGDGGSVDPEGRFTILVKGPTAGRWRIGRHFTAEPTSIRANELTEAQLMALRNDPALMVSVIDAPY